MAIARLDGPGSAWKVTSNRLREEAGMTAKSQPWTIQSHIQLRGLPQSERMRDLINVVFTQRYRECKNVENREEVYKGVVVDVSLPLEKSETTTDGRWPKLSGKSLIYSFQHDLVFSGSGHMQMLGWPRTWPESSGLTDDLLRDLAGSVGDSVPIAAVIVSGLWLNPLAPWWRPPDQAQPQP